MNCQIDNDELPYIEKRPWGEFEVLLKEDHLQVKKITVNSLEEISYQYHTHRNEQWSKVSGEGIVTLDESNFHWGFKPIFIKAGQKHSVYAASPFAPLVFIEVQSGMIISEDDIVRIKDRYGRVLE